MGETSDVYQMMESMIIQAREKKETIAPEKIIRLFNPLVTPISMFPSKEKSKKNLEKRMIVQG